MITREDMVAFEYYDEDWEEEFQMQQSPQDMVEDFYHKAGFQPKKTTSARLLGEEFEEWLFEFECDVSPKAELKELADLAYVVFGYAQSRGWDLMEALRRVHQNNMERMYQDDGTIKRREDGKILKNPNTPKVDLSDLV